MEEKRLGEHPEITEEERIKFKKNSVVNYGNRPVLCPKCNYRTNWWSDNWQEYEKMRTFIKCPKCQETTFETDFGRLNTIFKLKGPGWSQDGYQSPPKSLAEKLTNKAKKRLKKQAGV